MNSIPPEARPWLAELILVTAVKEDVVGPIATQVHAPEYLARWLPDFRRAIEESVADGRLQVPPGQLDELARLAALEMHEIRRLHESLHSGQTTRKAVCRSPLYAWYSDYFDESPRVVALALEIAIHFARGGEPPNPQRN